MVMGGTAWDNQSPSSSDSREGPHQSNQQTTIIDTSTSSEAKQQESHSSPSLLHSSESTFIETQQQISRHNPQHESGHHQVIAVSASKGPAAFFNLARKFLATDDICDLSALEGAIVSAVDAAHLLERSKIADIVRVQTSYVPVEPKRKKSQESPHETNVNVSDTAMVPSEYLQDELLGTGGSPKRIHLGKKGAPLRRSRIIITVKRTEDYRQWLEDNPYHVAGHGDDINDASS